MVVRAVRGLLEQEVVQVVTGGFLLVAGARGVSECAAAGVFAKASHTYPQLEDQNCHGDVGSGHTDGTPRQLAGKVWQALRDSLCGTCAVAQSDSRNA